MCLFALSQFLMNTADVYNPGKVLTFTVTLPPARYDTPEKKATWYAASLDKLRALPGVTHAEVANALPYSDMGWVRDCAIENHPMVPGKFQSALQIGVSEGYFSAFHIPMVAGRGFSKSDALGSLPVAVVSRKFVDQYFPGENPIGHRIRMGAARAIASRGSPSLAWRKRPTTLSGMNGSIRPSICTLRSCRLLTSIMW